MNNPSARQLRLLTGLARGNLIWEVPGKPHFTQFDEHTGRESRRVLAGELLAMEQKGWVRRPEPQEQRLLYWEITAKGRRVIGTTQVQTASRPGNQPPIPLK